MPTREDSQSEASPPKSSSSPKLADDVGGAVVEVDADVPGRNSMVSAATRGDSDGHCAKCCSRVASSSSCLAKSASSSSSPTARRRFCELLSPLRLRGLATDLVLGDVKVKALAELHCQGWRNGGSVASSSDAGRGGLPEGVLVPPTRGDVPRDDDAELYSCNAAPSSPCSGTCATTAVRKIAPVEPRDGDRVG